MKNNEKLVSYIIKGKDGKDVFKIADVSKEDALKQWSGKTDREEGEAIVTQVGGLSRQQLRERKLSQPKPSKQKPDINHPLITEETKSK